MGWNGFIVRPVGPRPVKLRDGSMLTVDFEAIEQQLIAPAMARAGIAGSTTQDILAAGNIREDMFLLLAHADVVIADISLHNANVFYELGARHALRDRRTFMIRFATADDVPFDLKTDRYLGYDPRRPEASVDALAAALVATLAERQRVDSPIFNLLPALKAPSVRDLMPVPADFREELARAHAQRQRGHLALLADEAHQLPWGAEGLRGVAQAQRSLGALAAARDSLEALRTRQGQDLEADLQLATLHQKLALPNQALAALDAGALAASDAAVARALTSPALGAGQRAEALALRASNAKTRWMAAWPDQPPATLAPMALPSPQLAQATADYAAAFACDLNHCYSGVNALAMVRVRLGLALAAPQAWADAFGSDDEARCALLALQREASTLDGAVHWSLLSALQREAPGSDGQRWVRVSIADAQLLRDERPSRVQAAYRQALEGADSSFFSSVRRQWRMFERLGLMSEQLPPLQALADTLTPPEPEAPADGALPPQRLILFAGHRLDEPGRAQPRFPADRAPQALAAITQQLQALCQSWPAGTRVRGLAGGASGGDLLFHEACHALGIPSALYLPMPVPAYVAASVQVSGQPDWVPRFHAAHQRCQQAGLLRQLGDSAALPAWLQRLQGYDFWERNNRWLLHSGLALGGERLSLLLLWDGQTQGDGRGGTAHLQAQARAQGAEIHHLDTRLLFQLPGSSAEPG